MMKSDIKNIGTFSGDGPLKKTNFINLVSIGSSSKNHNWNVKPHYHSDIYQFFFITSGQVTFFFNEKEKHFSGNHIIIMPENNLHGFRFSEDIEGFVLSVSSLIIDKILQKDKDLGFQINRVRLINFSNYKAEFEDIMQSVLRMSQEFQFISAKEELFLETLLLLLIIKLYRMTIESDKEFVPSTRELGYYKEFIKLIKTDTPTNKNILFFTKSIGISKTHLNRVCHAIVGLSTKEVIAKHLIDEALVLMSNTEMTISEIAYTLDFKDISYFCRFFKKHLGVSPLNCKRNIEGVNHKSVSLKF